MNMPSTTPSHNSKAPTLDAVLPAVPIQTPDLTQFLPQHPVHDQNDTNASIKASKMCVSPKHNGQNLCAHHWLQQFKGKSATAGGMRDQFKAYWDGLGKVKQPTNRVYASEQKQTRWNKSYIILSLVFQDLGQGEFTLVNSSEEINNCGEVGAVNCQLETSFGTQHNGPIIFTECGPKLVEIVNVLTIYLLKDPTSAILQKWVDDLTISVELSFTTSGIPIQSLMKPTLEMESVSNAMHGVNMAGPAPDHPGKGTQHVQKLDSKILNNNSHDSNCEDLSETDDSCKSGAKLLPLLLQVSKHCHPKTNLKQGVSYLLEMAVLCEAAEDELNKKAHKPLNNKQQTTNIKTPTMAPAAGASCVNTLVTQPHTVRPAKGKNALQGFQTEGRKVLQDKGDYAVIKFYVCCGVPPSIANADKFKAMVSVLNQAYYPPSSTTLEDKVIINEAAKISHTICTHLQTCCNLTITFDGGKICKPSSVYTIHVTTTDCHAFCMELDDASMLSHSAEYILEALERVINKIGLWNFGATSTDNTGKPQKAHKILCQHFPHILNMQDACHLLNLGIKTAIGDTHFKTIYWAGKSVQHGLTAFQAIVENEALGIDITPTTHKSLNNLFILGGVRMKFELDLARLLTVIGPYAKAIQCLEGGHVTANWVYYYWLGITSQLDSLFWRNEYDLTASTIEDICAITNCRFNEIITDAPNDIYLVAFFLDPDYCNVPIYKKPNPLTIPPLWIRQRDGVAMTSLKLPKDIIKHIGLSLQRILRNEYSDTYENLATKDTAQTVMACRIPLLAKIHPTHTLKSLKEQLKS
ncbi:hypothetical protein BS17DRAFT_763855 [Gyrodon lividus]|nr:hypothetical protein BS17DRAFT_763855 [Gyrodon lividus]